MFRKNDNGQKILLIPRTQQEYKEKGNQENYNNRMIQCYSINYAYYKKGTKLLQYYN